jgi:16S rRNA (cytidine1402-2'-O)-methyltransferase
VGRSGGNTSAARAASGKGLNVAREPNRRPSPSKPAEPREPPRWSPGHPLAPGLHLVATPIGNLGDITLRALWVLRGADRILCEDTRVTGKLLARYGVTAALEPYHDHNADRVRPQVLARLRRGETLALVCDAGTPLVSDPGYRLVRDALAEGLPVTAAPGPSAAITALTLSGLPPEIFLFAGFLPPRQTARKKALGAWRDLAATLLFYEGPSRLAAALADMAETLGDRDAAVARELTKLHEEIRRGRVSALAAHYRDSGPPRGEVVIVVGPPDAGPALLTETEIGRRLVDALGRLSLRDAAARVAEETGLPRRDVYRRALALQKPGT